MRYIFITKSFKGQLKKFKRYFREKDIVLDVKDFVIHGLRKGETYLKKQEIYSIQLETVKLRVCFHPTKFRYLIGIINDKYFLPIIIDKKTGKHGKNLSLKASKATTDAIKSASLNVVLDYIAYKKDKTRATVYGVE